MAHMLCPPARNHDNTTCQLWSTTLSKNWLWTKLQGGIVPRVQPHTRMKWPRRNGPSLYFPWASSILSRAATGIKDPHVKISILYNIKTFSNKSNTRSILLTVSSDTSSLETIDEYCYVKCWKYSWRDREASGEARDGGGLGLGAWQTAPACGGERRRHGVTAKTEREEMELMATS